MALSARAGTPIPAPAAEPGSRTPPTARIRTGRSVDVVPPSAQRPPRAPGPESPADDDLLARARAGDAEAHARLFDRHLSVLEGRVRRMLPRAVQRKVSVSDVLQEARIVAFDRLEDFTPEGRDGYRAWV